MNNNFNIQKERKANSKTRNFKSGNFLSLFIPKLLCKYEIDWRKLKSPFFEVLNLKPVNLD